MISPQILEVQLRPQGHKTVQAASLIVFNEVTTDKYISEFSSSKSEHMWYQTTLHKCLGKDVCGCIAKEGNPEMLAS